MGFLSFSFVLSFFLSFVSMRRPTNEENKKNERENGIKIGNRSRKEIEQQQQQQQQQRQKKERKEKKLEKMSMAHFGPNTSTNQRPQSLLTGFYWVLLGFTGFYLVLLGFTGFYMVLLSFT